MCDSARSITHQLIDASVIGPKTSMMRVDHPISDGIPMNTNFDAIIIGTGQAGPPLAKRLSAAGMSVAVVERHLFGGTCVNTGCMPTKAMVASAYIARLAQRASDYGVRLAGAPSVDMQ